MRRFDDDSPVLWIAIHHAMALERDVMMQWRDQTLAHLRDRFTDLFAPADV